MGSGPLKDWKPVSAAEAPGQGLPREPHPEQMPGWPDQERLREVEASLVGPKPRARAASGSCGSGDRSRLIEGYERNARAAVDTLYTGPPDPLWDDRPGDAPQMRFVRLVERLARPATSLGRTVLDACKEVWTRVRHGGEYVLAPREEVSQAAAERLVRASMPRFAGRVIIASRRELLPKPEWMEEDRWRQAMKEHFQLLEGGGLRNVTGLMIDGVFPADARRFDIPARMAVDSSGRRADLFIPCENLVALMALCAGWAVLGVPEACRRTADFLVLAAKMPPVVVKQPSGSHLLLLCADKPL